MAKIVKRRQFTMNLSCVLTKKERLEFADKLGESADAVDAAHSKKKTAAAQFKSAQAEHERLSAIVSSGAEYREVTVEEQLDFDTLRYSQVRTDTGEVVFERDMTQDERQVGLLDASDAEEAGNE